MRSRGAATVYGYRCPACCHAWVTSRLNAAYRRATSHPSRIAEPERTSP
ncbi:hypothetical protein [Streptomyces hoynatensis]|nr:hypothetical protein [Streptomyces hoynatensis]